MCKVGVVSADSNKLNIPMRKSTVGPELEIVKRFIAEYKSLAEKRSWKHDVVIFIEPKLDTGYPDLLIAHYDQSKVKDWSYLRDSLSSRDLKILALLMNSGSMRLSKIAYTLGFKETNIRASLNKLENCDLAFCSNSRWRSAKKASFFSLERLVAIEVKTGNALEALNQAYRNTGFSSRSYTLLGNESMSSRLKDKYELYGVGAILGESFNEIVRPKKNKIPICYTSLLINEWIAKRTAMEMTSC